MKLEFYPLDFASRNDKEILIFARTTNGEKVILVDDSFQPFFYAIGDISIDDLLHTNFEGARILKIDVEKKSLLGKQVNAMKLYFNNQKELNTVKKKLEEINIKCYEHDIPLTRRYIVSKKIIPLTLYSGEAEIINEKARVPVYKIADIKQVSSETLTEPKIIAFDIETYGSSINPNENPILMISLYSDNLKKVFTWKKFETNLNYIEFVEDEAELIKRFKEFITKQNPDFIVGYSSDNFDLPYLKRRAQLNNIKLDIGLDYSELKVKHGLTVSASIRGIQHIDLFKFIRNYLSRTMQLESYDLNTVAKELINQEKLNINLEELSESWDKNYNLELFCKYNLRDSEIVFKIFEEIKTNLFELVKLVGLPSYNICRMGYSQIVEWYLIRRSSDFNQIIPNKPTTQDILLRRRRSYEGAFVFKPEPGIYDNIIVFDFRSLYPSIISSHNISPDSFKCSCCPENKVPGFDYWFCKQKKGFMSTVIEDLIKRRMLVKEIIKSILNKGEKPSKILYARSNVLKTTANAMYGYFGFFAARWYCIECAESITAYGRYYIKKVIEEAEKQGFKVIYSDTDSIFISLGQKTREQAMIFVNKINSELPGLMELEFQGFYPKGIFVSAKLSASGAKKKYALVDEKGNLKITGFEVVRRNWSQLAKIVQETVLKMILLDNKKQEALSYVREVIEDLRKKRIKNELLIIHTQLQKSTDDYTSLAPHVAVAQKLKEKGMSIKPGQLISYIITPGSGNISSRAKIPEECEQGFYDSDYYINNQVIPSVEKIFEILGYTREDLTEESSQSKLKEFFKR